ncbi:MAG: hypothetical protein ACXAE3_17775 [Candidatus Kariarchaeaceae archaeon]|jgi:hypothetical protein
MSSKDMAEYAKTLLRRKGKKADSKLDRDDISEILLYILADVQITSTEISELQKIRRYRHGNMEDDAAELFDAFYAGFIDGNNPRPEKNYILTDFVLNLMKGKDARGEPKVLTDADVRRILTYIIEDGRLSYYEFEQMNQIKDLYPKMMDTSGGERFRVFYNGLFNLFSKFSKQQTSALGKNSQPTYSSSGTQCGACYGSGQVTCSSCNGMGGRYEYNTSYDFEGNPITVDEWVYCGCSGGYVTCGSCSGSGSR